MKTVLIATLFVVGGVGYGQVTLVMKQITENGWTIFDKEMRISSERFQLTSDRVYIAGRDRLYIFSNTGNFEGSISVEKGPSTTEGGPSWIANFHVLEGREAIYMSTMKVAPEGGFFYHMKFFDLDGEFLGTGVNPNAPDPEQAYFRQMWELPDGTLLATNYWSPDRNGKNFAIELRKIDLDSDGTNRITIHYEGGPLYRRFFDGRSYLSGNKSLVLKTFTREDETQIAFVHPYERSLNVRMLHQSFERPDHLAKFSAYSSNSRPFVSMNLPAFNDTSPEQSYGKLPADLAKRPGTVVDILPTQDGTLILYRANPTVQLQVKLCDKYGRAVQNDAIKATSETLQANDMGVYIGHSENKLHFYMNGAEPRIQTVDVQNQ